MHDRERVARLRAGDEQAFRELVAEYGGRLARLARAFSRNEAVVEEAVQETWLAVVRGLYAFEGRSALSTWIFGILVNQARRLAVREHRQARTAAGDFSPAPPSPAGADDRDEREPGLDAAGHWREPPVPWGLQDPAALFLGRETLAVIEAALAELPEAQRLAVLLRDVEGLPAEAVCNILGTNDTHQRVLLHRGRARVRRALDAYLRPGSPGGAGRTPGSG